MRRLFPVTRIPLLVFLATIAGCGTGGDRAGPPVAYVTDVAAGAAADERSSPRLAVAAAADLRLALEALRPAIEAHCATAMTTTYGSSGQLARQISSGAPFALFLSADTSYVAEVVRSGRAAPASAAIYGRGRLAVVTRAGVPLPSSLEDLSDARYRTIAIANPDHAPYGRAAYDALRSAGILDRVEGRLVLGENVRQAVEYVDNGNADAGIVALALVIGRGADGYLLVPQALHEPITQAGVVIRGTEAERTARCALQYLLDPGGQRVLATYGFEPARE
ncbi:molybdate ABC transporter substrate-binding protein [Tepidiforma thermophila]|uniref:molybdate ABC transporter substrate-binding protein n=1 Tax=Tepidiforma thermophila (strain KCTC 52669 / CGMCC 1.13589 / G233) TaxID=2761530 RepID=UPI0013FD9870|nr:molybdate ABC transporter substrate-binding protein [Tepidiforma thermophila]